MEQSVAILLTLGGLFVAGLLADLLSRRTPLPRVTLLLVVGFGAGPSGLDVLPDFSEVWFPVITKMALVMVGFLLGEKLTLSAFRRRGKTVLLMSLGEVVAASTIVFSVLVLLGFRLELALILAGIAPASAPAATIDVVHQLQAKGEFSQTLLGIVAIDDAWGLLIFSFLLAIAQAVSGQGGANHALMIGVREVGGALLLGTALGIPMAYLTGRLRDGEPTQAEALGLVFLCGGLAVWWNLSYILAAMVLGATVANMASHHTRPFSAIEGIEWPFMILFFILAGASLHVDELLQAGGLGGTYMLCRVLGLMTGCGLGGKISGADGTLRRLMGLAIMPQAGVALGMALIAGHHFPALKDVLLPVVIGSTVVFELIGPIVTRRVLVHVGEANDQTLAED
jgi:Kef-type K+ transport system membrane component KefB